MLRIGKNLFAKKSYFKLVIPEPTPDVPTPDEPDVNVSVESEVNFEDYGMTNTQPMSSYASRQGGFV
jgi:hypothetical protein